MPENTANILNKAIDNLQTLSRNWAVLALTTSAESLHNTANFLNSLSAKLEVEAADDGVSEAAATEAEAQA